ncbi:MAG: hypothetical protein AB7U41_03445 [Dongiaceae bacterium]
MSTALKSTINAIPFTDPAAGGNDNLFLALGKGGIGTVEGGMMVQKPSVLAAQKALKEKQDKEQEQRESGDVTPPEAIETELDLEKLLALLAQQQLNIVELDEFMAGLPDSLQRARSRREVQIAVQAMMIMQMMAHLQLQRYPQSVPPPQIAAIQQLIQQLTTLAKQPAIAPDAVKNLPQLAAAAQLKESLQKAGIAPSPLAFAQMAAKQIGPALDKVLQNLQARVMEGNLSPTSAKQLQALIINLQQARMQMAVMMALDPKAPPSQNLQTLMNKLQQQNITLPPQMLRTLQQALASPANRALNMQALNLMVSRNLANMVGIRNQIMTAQAQMPPSLRQLMAANARDIYLASRVTLPQTIIASFANLRFAPVKPGSVQMLAPQNQLPREMLQMPPQRVVNGLPVPRVIEKELRQPPITPTPPLRDPNPNSLPDLPRDTKPGDGQPPPPRPRDDHWHGGGLKDPPLPLENPLRKPEIIPNNKKPEILPEEGRLDTNGKQLPDGQPALKNPEDMNGKIITPLSDEVGGKGLPTSSPRQEENAPPSSPRPLQNDEDLEVFARARQDTKGKNQGDKVSAQKITEALKDLSAPELEKIGENLNRAMLETMEKQGMKPVTDNTQPPAEGTVRVVCPYNGQAFDVPKEKAKEMLQRINSTEQAVDNELLKKLNGRS